MQVAAPLYSPTKLFDAPLRYPVRRVERRGSILENVRSVTCCSAHDGDHRDFSLFGRIGSALVKLLVQQLGKLEDPDAAGPAGDIRRLNVRQCEEKRTDSNSFRRDLPLSDLAR